MVRALVCHQCGPGSNPGVDAIHMWVEFVVGSLPCSQRFFSGYSGFPLSSKTNISKFQFDQESGRLLNCYLFYLFIYLFYRDPTLTSNRIFLHGFCSKFRSLTEMMYEKLFKAYKFFLFCPFTSNLFVNVKLRSA